MQSGVSIVSPRQHFSIQHLKTMRLAAAVYIYIFTIKRILLYNNFNRKFINIGADVADN